MLEEIYTWVSGQLVNNDIFAGVIGGSVFASLLYSLRSVPGKLWDAFILHGTCVLTVYNEDDAFDWVNEWLATQPYAKKSRRLKLSTFFVPDEENNGSTATWSLTPGEGRHFFWYRRNFLQFTRTIETENSGASQRRREQIEIRILGRNSALLREMINEAKYLHSGADHVEVFIFDDYWRRAASRIPRQLDSVVLPKGQIERLIYDASWFFDSQAWYCNRGIPYRRGYLLSGPPGCGKTSLVLALASYFKRPIYSLNMGSLSTDSYLFEALSMTPRNAILLIEDIDAAEATKNRRSARKKKDDTRTPVTLSGLLNGLDGVASKDGRLLIMTSNHPEVLDPALIRPGRIDMHEKIGPLNAEGAERLFMQFFPGEDELGAALRTVVKSPLPAAELQALFMTHSDDPVDVVAAFAERAT